MTTPTNPILPVVACVIWNLTRRPDMPLVIAESAHRALGAHSTDLPAVAVPLALFEDEGFRTAVVRRHQPKVNEWIAGDDPGPMPSVFDAIAAELRERAEKGVGG
jgi:hypothetical protein